VSKRAKAISPLALLAQPGFFDALWEKDQFEVKAYWVRIETQSPLRMEQIYIAVIQEPARDSHHAWGIGVLLDDTGKPEAALQVLARLVKHYREQGDHANLESALCTQAVILYSRGDLDGAMALHNRPSAGALYHVRLAIFPRDQIVRLRVIGEPRAGC
jgi:hypothetical protein